MDNTIVTVTTYTDMVDNDEVVFGAISDTLAVSIYCFAAIVIVYCLSLIGGIILDFYAEIKSRKRYWNND